MAAAQAHPHPHSPAHSSRPPRNARGRLRLTTGLILFTYMVLHMVNHVLALFSLDLAERALAIAVAVWHSVPGSIILYGAAGAHFTLALLAVYEKHTLRLPPIETVRIIAGFTIPALLIAHLASTRIAYELYDAAPQYSRVVAGIWASDGQARQLALLAPGWLHGCLGIHIAFSTRRWYKRMRYLLWPIALLLPLFAGAGFLAMVDEIAARGVLPPKDAFAGSLANLRGNLYVLYASAIISMLGARWLRQRQNSRR